MWKLGPIRPRGLLIAVLFSVLLAAIYFASAGRYQLLCTLLFVGLVCVYFAVRERRRLQDVLVLLCSFFFGMAAVEGLALQLDTHPLIVVTPGLVSPHRVLGWAPAHPGRFHEKRIERKTDRIIFEADYTIDKHLLRETISAPDGATVAFFGDSWTFGVGVEDKAAVPQSFADLTGRKLRILNLGFGAYGPQQYLREIETGLFDELLGPQLRLAVFTIAPFQAERTACKPLHIMEAPRYRLIDGEVLYQGFCTEGSTRQAMKWLWGTGFYPTYIEPITRILHPQDMDLFLAVMSRTITLAKQKYHVPILIVYDPDRSDYLNQSGLKNEDIVRSFRAAGADVLEMDISNEVPADAVTNIPGDGHPTALAQHARAVVLKRYLEAKMSDLFLVRH